MPNRANASSRARVALIAALLIVLGVAILTILFRGDDAPAHDGAAGRCIQPAVCAVDTVWTTIPSTAT